DVPRRRACADSLVRCRSPSLAQCGATSYLRACLDCLSADSYFVFFFFQAEDGIRDSRPVNALCLISGHEGQEIPGLVDADRVVVDAEHMQQALGPATLTEIFRIRKAIGEHVYISTNVSETPQIVRAVGTGQIDVL